MKQNFGLIAGSSLAIIAAQAIFDRVPSGVTPIVHTAPLWIVIVLGAWRSHWVKWVAFPCFVFYLILFIFGWHMWFAWGWPFSTTDAVMAVIVTLASMLGIAGAWRVKSTARVWPSVGIVLLVAALQVGFVAFI